MYPLYEDIEDLDVRMERFRGFKRVASGLDVPKHVRICWVPHGPGCAHQQYHHGCFTPHSLVHTSPAVRKRSRISNVEDLFLGR